jgi:uncharacterized RDD family membrane protein YckC
VTPNSRRFGWSAEDSPGSRRGQYAGVVTRGIAITIDAVIVSTSVGIGVFLVRSVLSVLDAGNIPSGLAPAAAIASAVFVSFVVYGAIGFWAFGKTIGKFLMGIRVVRPDGSALGAGQSLVRALAYSLSNILFLGYVWALLTRRHRAWHDIVARTVVVYDWDAHAADPLRPRNLTPHLQQPETGWGGVGVG